MKMQSMKKGRNFLVLAAGLVLTVGLAACSTDDAYEKVAMPTADPPGGTVALNEEITLRCASAGASIYYTQDDGTPSRAATLYSESSKPKIAASGTLKAIAIKEGWEDSSVLSVAYTVNAGKVATPTANPAGGMQVIPGKSITLSSSTAGASIRYTLNGTAPTSTSGTEYSDTTKPVIAEACTLKAIAYKTDMEDSDVLSASYTIGFNPITGFTVVGPGSSENQKKFSSGMSIRGIAWGNGRFVAAGEDSNGSSTAGGQGQIAWSSDGSTWTKADVSSVFPDASIHGVAWGSGKFVAVGVGGRIAYSTTGETWTAVPGTSTTFNNAAFNGIIWGGPAGSEKFVAVANGGKGGWSADGTTWNLIGVETTGLTGSDNISNIAYGAGKYVAVVDNGKIAWSTDLAAWTVIPAGTGTGTTQFSSTQHIKAIAYGGATGAERFIAGGVAGIMITSTDGASWQTFETHGKDNTQIFRAMTWGAGRFVAAGGTQTNPQDGNSFIIVSEDGGQNWTSPPITTNTVRNFFGAAYGGGKFVLVANFGKLAYSNSVE
jgi:hypothetical protein